MADQLDTAKGTALVFSTIRAKGSVATLDLTGDWRAVWTSPDGRMVIEARCSDDGATLTLDLQDRAVFDFLLQHTGKGFGVVADDMDGIVFRFLKL